MSKSVLALGVGILVNEGMLDLDQTTWNGWEKDDPRRAVRVRHLLHMASGLDFEEQAAPFTTLTKMLYQSSDMATFAAQQDMKYPPGSHYSYSSGDSMILSKIVASILGDDPETVMSFFNARLFSPMGVHSAVVEFDPAGTIVASSYMLATARDWARIGELILHRGMWNGREVVPASWIDFMTTPSPLDKKGEFGAHLWLNVGADGTRPLPKLPPSLIRMQGYSENSVSIVPERDLVVVRLGATIGPKWDREDFMLRVLELVP